MHYTDLKTCNESLLRLTVDIFQTPLTMFDANLVSYSIYITHWHHSASSESFQLFLLALVLP